MDQIDFIDKFYAKYMPEWHAYPAIRDYFLDHDYDYLIIWADDLIAAPHHLRQLMSDVTSKAYEVIGGVCQIDNYLLKEKMAISRLPVKPVRQDRIRTYESFTDYYNDNGDLLPQWCDNPILKTKWQGFPLTCISRAVVKAIPFRNDSSFNGLIVEFGCCSDDAFCWDCIQDEIDMYSDLRIRCHHLRSDEKQQAISFEGKLPVVRFVAKK